MDEEFMQDNGLLVVGLVGWKYNRNYNTLRIKISLKLKCSPLWMDQPLKKEEGGFVVVVGASSGSWVLIECPK